MSIECRKNQHVHLTTMQKSNADNVVFRNSLNFMIVISLYVCCINKCT